MLRRSLATIALLFAAALPLAHGQSLPFVERDLERGLGFARHGADTQVLPVVSRSDGRLEALLLLDAPPTLNPLDQLLSSPRPRLGAAARLRLDHGNSLEAALKLDRGPALALLCDESIGLATTLASLNQHCLLAPLDAGSEALLGTDLLGTGFLGTATSRQLETAWRNERLGIDLSFGLSWLDSGRLRPEQGESVALPALAALLMPGQLFSASLLPGQFGFSVPELAGARLISRGIGVRGMFDLGSQRWLSFGGSHSRNRLEAGLFGVPGQRQWERNALSLGLGQGNLYGELTGHVSDLPGSDAFWGGVDVGISWRMPWDARLTVGARNLISLGSDPWLEGNGDTAEEPDTRVPYVRYRQDL